MNNVILIGRLGADPELKTFDSGTMQAICRLAVSRPVPKDSDKVKTDWLDLRAWGKTAEVISDYCKKGSQIGVVGRVEKDEWEDSKSGEKRSRIWITADRVELLGGKKEE